MEVQHVKAEERVLESPQDRALDPDATALGAALSELIRVYQFYDRDCICCHGISVRQCDALEALLGRGRGRGPLTLNELSAQMYLDKSTASRIVAALEKKGYVTRTPHPEDGRAVLLDVTDEGRALSSVIRRDGLDQLKKLIGDFDPAVRAAMPLLLNRLAGAAAAHIDTSGGRCCTVD